MDENQFVRICDCLKNDDPTGPEWKWEDLFDFCFEECEDRNQRVRTFLHSFASMRLSFTNRADRFDVGRDDPFCELSIRNLWTLQYLQILVMKTDDDYRDLDIYIYCKTKTLPLTRLLRGLEGKFHGRLEVDFIWKSEGETTMQPTTTSPSILDWSLAGNLTHAVLIQNVWIS